MSTDKIELKHAEDSTVDSPQPEYLKEVTHLLSELTRPSRSLRRQQRMLMPFRE